ncbi:glycosyltransferase [Mucilaginibacter sp. RS28]|uniref:Glycosyltransferase n=1 Tax=Mucilaginibacter straminoryzae TaxID=2932774 RepID=A0A9X1X2X4_9SPHI|nr:glycosyltransferase [Mucilaginibacter straminoryzae]MCJ8210232.1 glycosyltransferase [Mucilaginibacter straminoryzae]
MRIVFFTHPAFLNSQSMPRFATMLAEGMKGKGHEVELWNPEAFFYKAPVPDKLKKWMGYLDQFIAFPLKVRKALKQQPVDTLYVFTDHALGPWVPLVADRPHVIHCHDFLAQRSAMGEIPENVTGITGRKYQEFIRNGYKRGQNFISVSKKTEQDLLFFLNRKPRFSTVIYNGLNSGFQPLQPQRVRQSIQAETGIDVSNGYLLHVGGNQWYKNRVGVVKIYKEWRAQYQQRLPLLLIGAAPTAGLLEEASASDYSEDIYFLVGKGDDFVQNAYAGATLFLFPSLAEGFGWPIAEAMASGCPVITTNEAPMTEVGGIAASYIPKMPHDTAELREWLKIAAKVLQETVNLSVEAREAIINSGYLNIKKFDLDQALNLVEQAYQNILADKQFYESVIRDRKYGPS